MEQRELAGNSADGVGYGSPVPSSQRATGSNRPARQDPKSPEAIRAALLRYRVMAYIVGVGLIILVFIGVPLQYGAGEPQVVSVVGPVHGFLYMVYLVSGADLARRGRWTLKQVLGVVAAGFLPFLAFIMEHYVTRRVLGEMETASQGWGFTGLRTSRLSAVLAFAAMLNLANGAVLVMAALDFVLDSALANWHAFTKFTSSTIPWPAPPSPALNSVLADWHVGISRRSMEIMERNTITREGLSPRSGLSEKIAVEKERLLQNRQKPRADLFMCRILCIPEEHGNVTEDQAHKMFSLSIALSGLRCLLSYIVLPILLPLLGLATGIGPVIGIPVGIVALIFDVKGIRRFWLSSHQWRWPISIMYIFVIVMVLGLVIVSIIHLAA